MFSLFYLYIVRNDDNKDDQSIKKSEIGIKNIYFIEEKQFENVIGQRRTFHRPHCDNALRLYEVYSVTSHFF